MSIIATISDLFKGCPRNIKRRLLRDILLILFVTSGGILAIVLIQGIKTQRDISAAIITKANNQVKGHFQSFIDPLSNISKLLRKWGESGLLKIDEPKRIATQFQALMEIQPTIHSITLASDEDQLLRLSRQGKQWQLEIYTKSAATSSYWLDGELLDKKNISPAGNNISRTTWFRGAILADENLPFFLTEPYLEKGSSKYLITVSSRWNSPENSQQNHVTALSFSTDELMTHISQLQITPNSHIVLYDRNGTMLNDFGTTSTVYPTKTAIDIGEAGSSRPLTPELLAKVGAHLTTRSEATKESISIRNDGKTWWLGLSPLLIQNENIWVAVLIPEADIFEDIQQQWLRFGLLVAALLIGAILMTIFLVKRYSHQLKNLPQQHLNSHSFASELAALIRAGESTTLEFKSTMRTNLKSGKVGKEIEIAWLKTVVAFMNSDGGILLIGVDDSGIILGTESDNFANEDRCRLHFKNLLNSHIGAEFTRFIHFKLHSLQDKSIILVECERVRRPVFLTMGKQEDFFIRSGPSSMKLSMSQMVKYLAER